MWHGVTSLRETVVRAKLASWSDISDVALLKRLRNSEEYALVKALNSLPEKYRTVCWSCVTCSISASPKPRRLSAYRKRTSRRACAARGCRCATRAAEYEILIFLYFKNRL